MAGNEVPFSDSLKTQGNMQQTLPLQNATKADVSDKQTLLAVLQFLKKNNLKVWINHYAPCSSNFLCRVLSYTSKDYTLSRVNAFHVLLFKGTEELLKREASIKDDDVRPQIGRAHV